jgi:hypothetical protein
MSRAADQTLQPQESEPRARPLVAPEPGLAFVARSASAAVSRHPDAGAAGADRGTLRATAPARLAGQRILPGAESAEPSRGRPANRRRPRRGDLACSSRCTGSASAMATSRRRICSGTRAGPAHRSRYRRPASLANGACARLAARSGPPAAQLAGLLRCSIAGSTITCRRPEAVRGTFCCSGGAQAGHGAHGHLLRPAARFAARRAAWYCLAGVIIAELHGVQARVVAVGGQQLGVGAAFDDASLVHDQDQIGFFDGRQAVRDDQRRPPGHHPVEGAPGCAVPIRCRAPRSPRRESGSAHP